ncbi:TetR/AcrR family transcriptional regulator [Marinobacter fonticola]|uniref:TetR/AcrR family transcriptional regulator n=1 Tax=Marinobacter fonticola TaxID=2603215 RepID=UPI0011E7D492|nr:TetR/AcrR family transcriptional regulator [Marinobacter fonticola]
MAKQASSPAPRVKPLKRPRQARARFTVQAIFDAYVRIWQRDGWNKLTTRKVALETGVAVGTLYDYFPSKEALHSGYVRHCIEQLIARVDEQVVAPDDMPWRARIQRLIRLLCGQESPAWFHPDMMDLEPRIADSRLQQRAYDELLGLWQRVIDACDDLAPVAPETVEALHLAVWGGRRYGLLVRLDAKRMARWAAEMERLCIALMEHDPPHRS